MKTCKICKQNKPFTEFNPSSVYNGKQYYRGECKACNALLQRTPAAKARVKKYRSSDKFKQTRKKRRSTEKYKEQYREYSNNRKKVDELYKLKKTIRDRTGKAVKAKGLKKVYKMGEYLGCSPQELKDHLQKQFKEGMDWSNRGFGVGKWNIDHIKPLSLAKNIDEMKELSHYTNLQPLWHVENQIKSDKYEL